MTKDEAARLMSMKVDSISEVYDVADGVLVVTSEGAQTLIVDGKCSAVFPRRAIPFAAVAPVANAAPIRVEAVVGDRIDPTPAKKTSLKKV